MSIYHTFKVDDNYTCPICWQTGEDDASGPFVSHGGNGDHHPVHRDCVRESINFNGQKCPSCRADIRLQPSLFERVKNLKTLLLHIQMHNVLDPEDMEEWIACIASITLAATFRILTFDLCY